MSYYDVGYGHTHGHFAKRPCQNCRDKAARIEQLEADKEILLCAMHSIASSSCCEDCQEAKKVAVKCINDLAALEQPDE